MHEWEGMACWQCKDLGQGLPFLSKLDLAQESRRLGMVGLGFGGLEAEGSYGWWKDTNI